ncbi:ABC transporter ATP-binding protein [Streptomyces sp. WAC05374]|uniref:ABC transporter transmembrane domain-containing protein n=1 Tax=Streptomyces sp. WAC05374 TaxID=2487420 RepID=UPI000F891564|nr:ABC transporter ATP-binding protein [Streptomyces sp. WAC05374]RST19007.1 ABC transporter ATP-binding protein [Streptomyces sp. WAC05374]TDF50581.1 ABC transporter ATP-binding protein [Streptomyces sp. WAC05374]TDF56870.1 ABC transporter ATP-binding protein [Streptomyces sp. WAC05374]TDF60833.1 ABC transporter ATP-binding protein [Streptomyces sp. WAC05374]
MAVGGPTEDRPTGARVLRGTIRRHRRPIIAASFLGIAHQGCEALVPVVIGLVIDEAVATGSAGSLVRWLLALAALFLVLSTCYRTAARITDGAGEHAAHALRLRLGARVLDPRGGADAGRLPGALTAVATNDATRVGAVAAAVPYAVSALAGLAVSAVLLLRVSVPLGLLVLLGVPPLLWIGRLISGPLEARSEVEQERAAHASGVAADLVAGLRVLKGIGAEDAAVSRYRRTSRDSLAAALRAARSRAWHDGAILALTGIFIAVIGLAGAHLAMRGDITVGELVAAVGLAQYLLGPFQLLTYVNGEFALARASAGRIAEVLASPPAVTSGDTPLPRPLAGHVRLRGLAHGALRGVDLDITAGSVVGVVAKDPATAHDLLLCLGRELDPDEGAVELDGTATTELAAESARRAILVAHHDADLFEASLLDNVRAGTDAGAPGLGPALSAAAADDVARALPQGTATVLSERGRSLSGGQRQRVALARALAADPPVLVVHDPTTAVDTVTESRIASRLRDLRRGRTTILVTTSPALLAATDRVVLLEDGAVAAEGRHGDLVATHAAYRSVVLA